MSIIELSGGELTVVVGGAGAEDDPKNCRYQPKSKAEDRLMIAEVMVDRAKAGADFESGQGTFAEYEALMNTLCVAPPPKATKAKR